MTARYSNIVVGGGFFGCALAAHLCRTPGDVLLVEAEPELMTRASYHNQARVHNGYHYPRSFQTAVRSHLNFDRFVREFDGCVDRSFNKVYAIARKFSHVTAGKFYNFCRRAGAPIAPAPESIARLFDPDLIEAVFSVTEYAFDARKLRVVMQQRLADAGVHVELGTAAWQVAALADGALELQLRCAAGSPRVVARDVYNCTYADLNGLLARSHLPAIPLKHEWTELALVKPPPRLADLGVTVMCGPFFSLMPFPARGLHTLSHVRYTPHCAWSDQGQPPPTELPRASAFVRMQRDAARYLPDAGEACYVDSLWQVKTILPRNEVDDGRPVMYRRDHGLPGLHCVLGAKIDNVFDLLDMIPVAASAAAACTEPVT